MNGYYFFISAFVGLGLYCQVMAAVTHHRLNPADEDYEEMKKKVPAYIKGGLGFIIIGVIIYISKVAYPMPW